MCTCKDTVETDYHSLEWLDHMKENNAQFSKWSLINYNLIYTKWFIKQVTGIVMLMHFPEELKLEQTSLFKEQRKEMLRIVSFIHWYYYHFTIQLLVVAKLVFT